MTTNLRRSNPLCLYIFRIQSSVGKHQSSILETMTAARVMASEHGLKTLCTLQSRSSIDEHHSLVLQATTNR